MNEWLMVNGVCALCYAPIVCSCSCPNICSMQAPNSVHKPWKTSLPLVGYGLYIRRGKSLCRWFVRCICSQSAQQRWRWQKRHPMSAPYNMREWLEKTTIRTRRDGDIMQVCYGPVFAMNVHAIRRLKHSMWFRLKHSNVAWHHWTIFSWMIRHYVRLCIWGWYLMALNDYNSYCTESKLQLLSSMV